MCSDINAKNISEGFSLIEVMIALLVLGIGSAGLALLLMAAVQGTAQAQNRSQAAIHASELAQLIQANPATVGHFIYPVPEPQNCGEALPCSAVDWAAGHLQSWQQELEQLLALAEGVVCRDATPQDGEPGNMACDGRGQPLVKIAWQELPAVEQQAQIGRVVLPLIEP